MRIAIPLADDTLAEHFSRAGTFALYDVDNDTRAVQYLGRQSIVDPACSRTPPFLHTHNVEVVMARHISENALGNLLQLGILAIQDAPPLPPDALIAHLVSGTLQATPPNVSSSPQSSCTPQGCSHCGHHAHTE